MILKAKLKKNLNLRFGCFLIFEKTNVANLDRKINVIWFFLSRNPIYKLLSSRQEIIENQIKDNKS
jgi:hypothetical protein